jgi:hypothetical protein
MGSSVNHSAKCIKVIEQRGSVIECEADTRDCRVVAPNVRPAQYSKVREHLSRVRTRVAVACGRRTRDQQTIGKGHLLKVIQRTCQPQVHFSVDVKVVFVPQYELGLSACQPKLAEYQSIRRNRKPARLDVHRQFALGRSYSSACVAITGGSATPLAADNDTMSNRRTMAISSTGNSRSSNFPAW